MEQIGSAMTRVNRNFQTPISRDFTNRQNGTGTLSDADKLELCYRGVKFKERVYLPPEKKHGCKCDLCGDKGWRFYWYDGFQFAEECTCHYAVTLEENMKKTGAKLDMTFENFHTDHDYQIVMAEKAKQFVKDGWRMGQWFFIGGQVGCGKTHICTAILNELVKTLPRCRYMMWRDESTHLKAIINQQAEYHEKITELKDAAVLYIDDFWKTQQGARPTQADVNLAFQIINARYQNPNKVTIISCELSREELVSIDEAVGSRIHEKSRTYNLFISRDKNRNYRMQNP